MVVTWADARTHTAYWQLLTFRNIADWVVNFAMHGSLLLNMPFKEARQICLSTDRIFAILDSATKTEHSRKAFTSLGAVGLTENNCKGSCELQE